MRTLHPLKIDLIVLGLLVGGGCSKYEIDCRKEKCSLQVVVGPSTVIVGGTLEFRFILTSEAETSISLFQQDACNIKLKVREGEGIFENRVCEESTFINHAISAFKNSSDEEAYSPSLSKVISKKLGPNDPIEFSIKTETYSTDDGLTVVKFGDDIFFGFEIDTIVFFVLSLPSNKVSLSTDSEGIYDM